VKYPCFACSPRELAAQHNLRGLVAEAGVRVTTEDRIIRDHLCWRLGASQGDIANLKGEDVNWENSTVSFVRGKTGVPVLVRFGTEALSLFRDLPAAGSSASAASRSTATAMRGPNSGGELVTPNGLPRRL
jgi:integrase